MFETWSQLGEETRDERLARICVLPNRFNNAKCLAAGYRQGRRVASADGLISTTLDAGPLQTPSPTKPVLTGDVVTPTTAPAGPVPGSAGSGGGITELISSIPTWGWIAGGAALFFLMKGKR